MHDLPTIIALERHDARRYTVKLILAPRSRYAGRWRGLRAWHQAQVEKWRTRL